MPDYIDAIVDRVRARKLSDEALKMSIAFQVTSRHEANYGVEYVSREMEITGANVETKVDEFMFGIINYPEDYYDDFERVAEEYGDEINSELPTHLQV